MLCLWAMRHSVITKQRLTTQLYILKTAIKELQC